jgi:hypothetical protein
MLIDLLPAKNHGWLDGLATATYLLGAAQVGAAMIGDARELAQ